MIADTAAASPRITLPAASIPMFPARSISTSLPPSRGSAGNRFMSARKRLDADSSLRKYGSPGTRRPSSSDTAKSARLNAGPARQISSFSSLLHPPSGSTAENPSIVTLTLPAFTPHILAANTWLSSCRSIEKKAAAYSAARPAISMKTGIIAAVTCICSSVFPMTSLTGIPCPGNQADLQVRRPARPQNGYGCLRVSALRLRQRSHHPFSRFRRLGPGCPNNWHTQ